MNLHFENAFAGLDEAHARIRHMHLDLGIPSKNQPQLLEQTRVLARASWMRSEIDELLSATETVDQIDALMDILSHVLGTLVEMGVRPGVPMTLVYASNLAKRWPDGQVHLDSNGKLLKPQGWEGPEKAIARWLSELEMQNLSSDGNSSLEEI